MLSEYIQAAMHHARYKQFEEDGTYYGEIDAFGFDGVWANEATLDETERELQSALEDWLLLGIRLNHPLPVIGGIDLNPFATA